ncbi:cholinesterase 1-like [Liolophura sinensis]|uniref:cholinesterase 1-like n=1 Tax=Liolophura sinensis TaxID=3198878 RepID=UPI00315990A0
MITDNNNNVFVHTAVLSVLLLCVVADTYGPETTSKVRETIYGQVRGFVTKPLPEKQVENYLGIPYGRPPTGDLRFEPPEPPRAWAPNTRDARQLSPACLQILQTLEYIQQHRPLFNITSEDCLYLNIYVPITKVENEPLSVLVFIHGGSNMAGMGAFFDGDVLAAHGDIIVITFNYRLAALGFFGTGRPEFPGNYGLLDQVMLLRWVNENIGFFNGDPAKVTVMGHSAGSFNVGLHILSPMTKGLFRAAICLSGSPLSPVAVRRSSNDALSFVQHIARSLGCTDTDLTGMKECLKAVPQVALMKDFPEIYVSGYHFPTIVDNIYISKEPAELFQNADLNVDVVVTGVTKDEGVTFVNKAEKFHDLEATLKRFKAVPKHSKLFAIIKHEYTHWQNEPNNTAQAKLYAQAFGDAVFNAPLARMADLLVGRNATVYVYRFEYRSSLDPRPLALGVPHGADLFFLFGCPFSGHPKYSYTEADRSMSHYYMDMVGNIVKDGKATYPVNMSDPSSVRSAPTYSPTQQQFIRFHENEGEPRIDLGNNFRTRKIYLWNKLLPFLDETFTNESTETGTSVEVETDNIFVILFGVFLATTIIQIVALAGCCILLRRRR